MASDNGCEAKAIRDSRLVCDGRLRAPWASTLYLTTASLLSEQSSGFDQPIDELAPTSGEQSSIPPSLLRQPAQTPRTTVSVPPFCTLVAHSTEQVEGVHTNIRAAKGHPVAAN